MNARKIFLVLGGACVVLLIAAIVVALWLFAKNERDRNRDKTEPARKAKLEKKEQQATTPEPKADEVNFKELEMMVVDEKNT